MRTNKIIKCCMLILIVLATSVIATNNIVIESLNANIDITQKAIVSINYTLRNINTIQESVNITIKPIYTVFYIEFDPNSAKSLNLEYELPILEVNGIKLFNFDPQLLFNDQISTMPIMIYNLNVKLPPDINKILTTNKKEYGIKEEDSRTIYSWSYNKTILQRIDLSWSTIPIDLTINKTAILDNDVLKVNLDIKNNKNSEITNIRISDYFPPADFEILDGENFELVTGTQNDKMIIWEKEINFLPQESKVIEYSIKLTNQQSIQTLKPTRAYYNKSLMAISNEIILYPEFCGNNVCGAKENNRNCALDCPKEKLSYFIIILTSISIIIILIIIYYIYKKYYK